jgi:hypothetical protein
MSHGAPTLARTRRWTRTRLSATGWRKFVRGRDVAVVYAITVTATELVLGLLPDNVHQRAVIRCSTNLYNLHHNPMFVLAASAFVVNNALSLWQLPILIWAYGAAQRWVGRLATVIVGVLGHVGATLFVATVMSASLARGRLERSATHVSDVGISYGLMCILGFLISRVPDRYRPVYIAALLAFAAGPLLSAPTFTALGHVSALTLGLGLALLAERVSAATVKESA